MSFNQPPPNPYGQPPQQAGPPPGYGYPQQGGIPQQPQQPAPYGYPQQAQNPYGQPPQGQGPYGAPPQGQPNPYGQQPGWGAPPPPPKKNTGKVIGIVLAVVVVVGGGIGIAVNMGGGGSDGARYKLTTPQTVATDYTKQPGTDTSSSDSNELSDVPGMTDAKQVQAQYRTSAEKTLTFIGAYGSIGDPESAVDAAFAAFAKEGASGEGNPVGDVQTVHPAGFDGTVMKCQQYQADSSGTELKFPLCVWGDSSTIGLVAVADPAKILTGGTTSIDEAAGIAAQVRTDTRVKIS